MKELVILTNILDISQASTVFEKGILPTVITANTNEVLSDFKDNYALASIGGNRVAYYFHAMKSNEKVVGIIGPDGICHKTMGNPTENATIRILNEDGSSKEVSLYGIMKEQLATLRTSEYEKQGILL